MPKLAIQDIELNYEEQGEGYPLVLIHGLNGDCSGWAGVMPELSRHYRVIAPDLRGHGASGKPDLPYSIPLFAQDLFEFYRGLELERAHLLGLSMGGAIAQQFVLDHPEKVNCLILVSTFSRIDSHLRSVFQGLREKLRVGGYPAFFDEVVRLAFTSSYISSNSESIADLKQKRIRINSPVAIGRATEACLSFHLGGKISAIAHPTLILSGREDIFTPLSLAEEISRSIRGSEWRIMEGVGHNLHLERPAEMVSMMLDFLAAHQGR
jgi:pimeloyl-ACP methyl ester carboxylesterase